VTQQNWLWLGNNAPCQTHQNALSATRRALSAKKLTQQKLRNDDSFRAPLSLPRALGLGARPRVRPMARGVPWVTRWVHWVQSGAEAAYYIYWWTYLYSAYEFRSVTKRFGRQINEFSKTVATEIVIFSDNTEQRVEIGNMHLIYLLADFTCNCNTPYALQDT